ncbi:MAG TPA: lysophospholipid acyltransferase family protein [Gemmataceae bacterium]|nr:lysophospholipid acyltransferase family protein [Gemmataceae bacterium]
MSKVTSYAVHKLAYMLSATAMPVFFRLRIEGGAHIPRTGPALLVANHQSFLDPILLGLCTPRALCYLARKSLFRNPFFAWLIRVLGAVPIDQQGVGKEGIKTILEQLQRGEAVVVFPEGERTRDGRMQPLRPGVHLLIKRTKAPIVPIGIAGAFDAWPRRHKLPRPSPLFLPAGKGTIAVSVGQPLDAARYIEMARADSLAKLFTELQRLQGRAERLRCKPNLQIS